MYGVFHQTIEAVQARDTVVHRMQTPQQRATVAGVMHQGDAQVGQGNGQQQLQGQRPLIRPKACSRQPVGKQRDGRHTAEGQAFVDQCMAKVAAAVALCLIPGSFVGDEPFAGE
ncbi:hypothetical protein D3C80_1533760 [compost metagenome]